MPELVLLLDVPPLSDAGFPDAGECPGVGRSDFALPDGVDAGLLFLSVPQNDSGCFPLLLNRRIHPYWHPFVPLYL